MATKVSIAQMRDRALQRLAAAADGISDSTGAAAVVMPEFDRDPDYLHAAQLTALADWAERIVEAVQRSSEVVLSERNTHVSKTKNTRTDR